ARKGSLAGRCPRGGTSDPRASLPAGGLCRLRVAGRAVEGGERLPERALVHPTADEDDARAAVLVRPRVEVDRWVDHVLDAVQDERPRAAHVEQALDPQYLLTARLKQHRQPD